MRIWFSPRCNTGFESLARTGRRVEDAIHHMKTKMTSIKTTLLVAGLLVAFAGASRAAEVQAGMKDENAIKIIKQGIVEKDKKKMDPYKDKFTDEEIKALIAYIRGFKK
jgi:cytochrome c1